jgi:hypothetical protein
MAREPGHLPREGEPLLTRLLRRRADEPAADEGVVDQDAASAATTESGDASPPSRIDPISGKPIDELVDADLPPLDSIGPDSDVRAFLGRNISPELRRQALRKLFHQPKFNIVCLCAEYAENYNNFTPMGAIVPHDLKRQLAIQAERLAKRALEQEAAAAGTGDPTANGGESSADDVLQRDSGEASTKVLSDAGGDSPDASHHAADQPQRG